MQGLLNTRIARIDPKNRDAKKTLRKPRERERE